MTNHGPSSHSRLLASLRSMLRTKAKRERKRPRRVQRHAPVLELLEDRLLLAAFSESGTQLDLDMDVANKKVTVVNLGSNGYQFDLEGDTWQGTDNSHVTGNGTSSLSVSPSGLAHFSTVAITDSAAGASVTFRNQGVNEFHDSFNVTLDDPGARTIQVGRARFQGAASFSASTSRNIIVNGHLSTVDGDLTLHANQQAAKTQGNFSGTTVFSTVESTSSGTVTVEGTASTGSTTARSSGVKVDGGRISGGTSGTLTVAGNGGSGSSDQLFGVGLTNSGMITSAGADVEVAGKGGTSPQLNAGVFIESGSQITAGANGSVEVTGKGGGVQETLTQELPLPAGQLRRTVVVSWSPVQVAVPVPPAARSAFGRSAMERSLQAVVERFW